MSKPTSPIPPTVQALHDHTTAVTAGATTFNWSELLAVLGPVLIAMLTALLNPAPAPTPAPAVPPATKP